MFLFRRSLGDRLREGEDSGILAQKGSSIGNMEMTFKLKKVCILYYLQIRHQTTIPYVAHVATVTLVMNGPFNTSWAMGFSVSGICYLIKFLAKILKEQYYTIYCNRSDDYNVTPNVLGFLANMH